MKRLTRQNIKDLWLKGSMRPFFRNKANLDMRNDLARILTLEYIFCKE